MCIKTLLLSVFAVAFFAAGIHAQNDQENESWPYLISGINITGNKKTSSEFILRELTFKTGKLYTLARLKEEIAKSRINLVNTALFINHEISVRYEIVNRSMIDIEINVAERWYFWPEPVLQNAERNFNVWLADPDLKKINWGINFIQDNAMGNNERLNFVLRFGYDQKYEIVWSDPSILKSRTIGLKAGFGFSGNHEVAYQAGGNRLKFIRTDDYILSGYYGFTKISHRPSSNVLNNFQVLVKSYSVNDTLLALNPDFIPGSSGRFVYADLSYFLKLDYRDHKAYPLEGAYGDLELRHTGISLDKNKHKSFTVTSCNVRVYNKIVKDLYSGIGITSLIASKKIHPFIFRQGFGYGRIFVRGYEHDVMHGFAYCLIKTNLKYAIVPERPLNLSFMPHDKFRKASLALYVNLFADAGYVFGSAENGNDLVNTGLYSAGIGLDFVTYYDKVIRIEAALNKLGRAGLYLHFIAPI